MPETDIPNTQELNSEILRLTGKMEQVKSSSSNLDARSVVNAKPELGRLTSTRSRNKVSNKGIMRGA